MLNQFSLYAIIFLIIALVATGGSFALYRNSAKAEIAALHIETVTLRSAVNIQGATITQMEKDAAALANANKFLNERFAQTESQFVDEWKAIDALDLASGTGEPGELEKRVNDEFSRSIEDLRKATGRNNEAAN